MEPWTEYNISIGVDHNVLKANVIIPKITGFLSMIGSGYIIQDVLRNPHKRTKSIYHRLMLGLSISDTIYSFSAFVLTSWPMPRDYFIMAAGTVATCDASAFFTSIGMFVTPLYNCSLVTYYLLQLKHNWADQRIRNVEKWLHLGPWLIGLGVAFAGLATKAFGPVISACWVTQAYPIECTFPGSTVECTRGGNNQQVYFVAIYFFMIVSTILYVSISMFRVYKAVATIERNSEKYSFVAIMARLSQRDENYRAQERKRKKRKRSRRVMVQGVLYSATMVLISIFPLVSFFQFMIRDENTGVIPQIEICIDIFTPLQGFFNTFIYLMPLFRRIWKARRERLKERKNKNSNKNNGNENDNEEIEEGHPYHDGNEGDQKPCRGMSVSFHDLGKKKLEEV